MNTIRYVFETRQPQLNKLVVNYGLSPATSKADLWKKTNFLVTKFREQFMKDLADIHPDKDLFAWRFSLDKKQDDVKLPSISDLKEIEKNIVEEKSSNACGCSGADGEKTSSCNGCDNMKSGFDATIVKDKIKDNMPLVIVGSLALVIGIMALSRGKIG